jgi:hypothetical protein
VRSSRWHRRKVSVGKVDGSDQSRMKVLAPTKCASWGTGEPLPPQAPIPPPLLAEVRQAHEEAPVAGATPEAVVHQANPDSVVGSRSVF